MKEYKAWDGAVAGVDIETDDPLLTKYGAGAVRGMGKILTVAIHCPDWNISGYYTWDELQDDEEAIDLLSDPSVRKVFHNGLYDLQWLCIWGGLKVENVDDTMAREALLDSYAFSYSLDNCCVRHGVLGKNKADTIDSWWKEHGGKGKAINNLVNIPVAIVGKYNLQDSVATYNLWKAQEPDIRSQNLVQAAEIDRMQIPWCLLCKKTGIALDTKRRDEFGEQLDKELKTMQKDFASKYGNVNIGSYLEMEQLFYREGIPLTYRIRQEKQKVAAGTIQRGSSKNDAGKLVTVPAHSTVQEAVDIIRRETSVETKQVLGTEYNCRNIADAIVGATVRPVFDRPTMLGLHHDYPVVEQIMKIRKLDKLLNTFIWGQFVDFTVKGRIHADFNPFKGDEHGTVTGRYSSSNINFQNIPARDGDVTTRSLFIPDKDCTLCAFDYKQIEYRVFAHFAVGEGAAEARKAYWDAEARGEPFDFHEMVQKLLGWYFPDDKKKTKVYRGITKNIDFGKLYGLGAKGMAASYADPVREAHPDYKGDIVELCKQLIAEVDMKVPFMRYTTRAIQQVCERRGYVKGISGRRQRMPPSGHVYVIVNYLCQGSAADIVKKAIADSWEAGVWNTLHPHGMVHDELVFSMPNTKEGYEAAKKLYDIMVHAYSLQVPIGVDTEVGPDWGHCTEDNWKEVVAKWENA